VTAPGTAEGVALAMRASNDDSKVLCALFDGMRDELGYSEASKLWTAACDLVDARGAE
jgi:hypothetical protein